MDLVHYVCLIGFRVNSKLGNTFLFYSSSLHVTLILLFIFPLPVALSTFFTKPTHTFVVCKDSRYIILRLFDLVICVFAPFYCYQYRILRVTWSFSFLFRVLMKNVTSLYVEGGSQNFYKRFRVPTKCWVTIQKGVSSNSLRSGA